MNIELKIFPANHGDSFLITIKEEDGTRNILVDGGTGKQSYRQLKKEFKRIEQDKQFIDLLVITHLDDDHIKGILDIFQDSKINKAIVKEVWFNSGQLISERLEEGIPEVNREIPLIINDSKEKSVRQGITLEKELEKLNIWSKTLVRELLKTEIGEVKLTVLSPDVSGLQKLNKAWEVEKEKLKEMSAIETDYSKPMKELLNNKFREDNRVPNGSSIAFLLEHKGKKLLFLGDSHPSVIERSLKRLGYSNRKKLKVEVVKVSHHGSKYNSSPSLLEMLECQNFIISTNGKRHGLPNKECLARIVSTREGDKETFFHFNYDLSGIFLEEDFEEFNFSCKYLSDTGYAYKSGE